MFSLQPDEQCNDKPQMAIIERYLNWRVGREIE
jgi:hypothetical protein